MKIFEVDYKTLISLNKVIYIQGPYSDTNKFIIFMDGGYKFELDSQHYQKFVEAWLNV
jgi:hypothetical protein